MKINAFIRFSLLFPYVVWVVFSGLSILMSELAPESESIPILSAAQTVTFIYVIGVVIWGIPYTILALGLWLWSYNKPVHVMAKVFAFSPVMMAVLVAIEMVALQGKEAGVSPDNWQMILALGALSLLFGYGIIGVVAGIYKLLQTGKIIQLENDAPPLQSA